MEYESITNPLLGIETPLCSMNDIKTSSANIVNVSGEVFTLELGNGEITSIEEHNLENMQTEIGTSVYVYFDKDNHSAFQNRRYKELKSLLAICGDKQNVKGKVTSVTNKGLLMDVQGTNAFMPNGQIDIPIPQDTSEYLGKTMDIRLINLKLKQHEGNRFLPIVSHKVIIEDVNAQSAEILVKNLHIGDIITGTVKSITNYGVFVTLVPGVDGLVHITDISWEKVHNLNDIIKIGQSLEVKILEIIPQKNGKIKISLGHKQTMPKPWDSLDPTLNVGDIVDGIICDIQDYGLFIKIPCGVEGLVHRTELAWDKEYGNPHDYKKFEKVKVKIIGLDREKEKLLLSIKQLSDNPWTDVERKVSVGQIIRGTINTITNFGVFVELGEGIHGLVHVSELSWFKLFGKPKEIYQIGDILYVKVMSIDKVNKKVELSLKKATQNPWPELNKLKDKIVDITVSEVTEKGIHTTIDSLSIPGFIPKLSYSDSSIFTVGMKLHCKVKELAESKGLVLLNLVNNGI